MQTGERILLKEFCTHHNVSIKFIYALQDSGLIEILQMDEELYLPDEQLPYLEKMLRLYQLDINMEGLETISHLLNRMSELQQEIVLLKNRLIMYE